MARRSDAYKERYLERLLSEIGPTNQGVIRMFIGRRRAEGLKVASLLNHAFYLNHLDEAAGGEAIDTLSADRLNQILGEYTRRQSPETANHFATHLRTFYRSLHDDELPRPIARALERKWRLEWSDKKPITEEARDALLEAASDGPDRAAALRRCALIWLLWDSGFRIGEAVALQVHDIEFDGQGGAHLRLRKGVAGLKTGPRTIYVVDCVGALRAWISMHPLGTDPTAYLFNNRNHPDEPMWPANATTMLRHFSKKAGIRPLHAHLFRHTRVTRAAKKGWTEAHLRGYFGWSMTSRMPAHYVHLAARDMEDIVRRDAGIGETGRRGDLGKPVGAAPALAGLDVGALVKQGIQEELRRLLGAGVA